MLGNREQKKGGMMSERSCHNCPLLERDYDIAVMHEKTFLYCCNRTVGVTTVELRKCRGEFCKMTDFMVRL